MAVEVCPDSPNMAMSPRISFSHDLSANDRVPIKHYVRSNASTIDFAFSVLRETLDQEYSSADELFFDGKILPIQLKKRIPSPTVAAVPVPTQPINEISKNISKNPKTESPCEDKHNSGGNKGASLWGFKRSSSLNSANVNGSNYCSTTLLSRSNSTGSHTTGVKRASNPKNSFMKLSSSSHPKPPLTKKSIHSSSYCNSVKSYQVLNVPPANLFGLGAIFSGNKDKNKKK